MNKPASILCAVILLVGATIAEAQQPGKIFRIGFLDPTNASDMAGRLEAFRQELSKLGWIEGKISLSSTGLPRINLSAYPSWRQSWFVSRLI